jgi:hypothetical protein
MGVIETGNLTNAITAMNQAIPEILYGISNRCDGSKTSNYYSFHGLRI